MLIETEGYDLLAQTADSPVIRLLNMVMTEAIQQGASDIHFEPSEQGLVIRYRIDGVLQLTACPSKRSPNTTAHSHQSFGKARYC